MSGLMVSKDVKCLLKTNRIVAAFPGSELIKILKKFNRLSLHIVVGPLTKFLK